jgi:transposase
MKTYSSTVTDQPVLGLDVAKATFMAALRVRAEVVAVKNFPNHGKGFAQLRVWLHQHLAGQVRAGLEATSVYGQKLMESLHGQGHIVHLLNPAQVAAFARSLGRRNKTDPADARMIAEFVASRKLSAWTPPPAELRELQDYSRLRDQLRDQRQQLRNQLESAPELTRPYLQRMIAHLEAELNRVDHAIEAHLRCHPALANAVDHLCSVPGVGRLTATKVLSELPPIDSSSDPRTLAAWAGLTPRRVQSGPREGRSYLSRLGNKRLRDALFMPSLVAKRFNPTLNAFAQRLALRGKSHGAILGAVAHKLLRILIGILRHDRDYDPNWISAAR